MYCTAPLSPRKGRLRSFRDDDDDETYSHKTGEKITSSPMVNTTPPCCFYIKCNREDSIGIHTFRNGITKGRSGKLVACWSFAWNSSTDNCEFYAKQSKTQHKLFVKTINMFIEIKVTRPQPIMHVVTIFHLKDGWIYTEFSDTQHILHLLLKLLCSWHLCMVQDTLIKIVFFNFFFKFSLLLIAISKSEPPISKAWFC